MNMNAHTGHHGRRWVPLMRKTESKIRAAAVVTATDNNLVSFA